MFTYPKKVRLRSKKLIQKLFEEGKSINKYPLRLVWIEVDRLPEDVLLQSAVSVSKKRFKRAVKRNLLKRRMREAIRLNTYKIQTVLDQKQKKIAFMLIYQANDIKNYKQIETSFQKILSVLTEKITSNTL